MSFPNKLPSKIQYNQQKNGKGYVVSGTILMVMFNSKIMDS